MSWIALKMLTGDKAKFFGIVLGLTFAALLITQQGSIFCGLMCRTAGQVFDLQGADLWVMDPNVRFIDDVKPMVENNLYRVRGVDGVKWAVPLYKGNARAKLNSDEVDGRENQVYRDRAMNKYYQVVDEKTGKVRRQADGSPVLRSKEGKRPVEGEALEPIRHEVIEQAILVGLDDASMVGAPPPERILVGSLEDLRKPEAVIVDFTRLRKLYPGEPYGELLPKPAGKMAAWGEFLNTSMYRLGLSSTTPGETIAQRADRQTKAFYARFVGRELEMNDHRAIIVGVCEATRTFQSNPVIYTKYSRAKLFIPQERKLLSYVLASVYLEAGLSRDNPADKAKIDARISEVGAKIKAQTNLRARSSQEFIWDTINYYLVYTGIPINFGITAFLGFLIGTAIAGQTFYNFTLDNLKQFGALKAMGATNSRIVAMILLQACVVGLLGYGIGVGLASLFGISTAGGELAFYTPWQILPITGVAVVAICILSSLLSVRRVMVLEPAVVFRG